MRSYQHRMCNSCSDHLRHFFLGKESFDACLVKDVHKVCWPHENSAFTLSLCFLGLLTLSVSVCYVQGVTLDHRSLLVPTSESLQSIVLFTLLYEDREEILKPHYPRSTFSSNVAALLQKLLLVIAGKCCFDLPQSVHCLKIRGLLASTVGKGVSRRSF